MSEHTWFQENLAGYCAGGLSALESERFDRHRIACSACARILAASEGFDEAMENLFAEVRPAVGWGNRVIDGWRADARGRVFRLPRWARWAASAAAILVLGVLGAVLQGFAGNGDLKFPGADGSVFTYLMHGSTHHGRNDERYAAVSNNQLKMFP